MERDPWRDPCVYDRIADAYAHLGIPRPDLRARARGEEPNDKGGNDEGGGTDGE